MGFLLGFSSEWESRGKKSLKAFPVQSVQNIFDGQIKHMLCREISLYELKVKAIRNYLKVVLLEQSI